MYCSPWILLTIISDLPGNHQLMSQLTCLIYNHTLIFLVDYPPLVRFVFVFVYMFIISACFILSRQLFKFMYIFCFYFYLLVFCCFFVRYRVNCLTICKESTSFFSPLTPLTLFWQLIIQIFQFLTTRYKKSSKFWIKMCSK